MTKLTAANSMCKNLGRFLPEIYQAFPRDLQSVTLGIVFFFFFKLYVCVVSVCVSLSVVFDSLWPYGL